MPSCIAKLGLRNCASAAASLSGRDGRLPAAARDASAINSIAIRFFHVFPLST
jgi:hypothetical protein